jgi:hypothetical protein
MAARAQVPKKDVKNFDARVMLTCWSLEKQRNARAFGNLRLQCPALELVRRIQDELAQWALARSWPVLGGRFSTSGE